VPSATLAPTTSTVDLHTNNNTQEESTVATITVGTVTFQPMPRFEQQTLVSIEGQAVARIQEGPGGWILENTLHGWETDLRSLEEAIGWTLLNQDYLLAAPDEAA
jgi:hypothetical protein